ncbi:GNAT family N-acetyltransferase [Bifidobacterium sp.]|jgi:GNAT superfamily N-acetyltransferase|uniref:GNAT family N-acetyltransferase n=1 Tax=Bifidobacterium sp. TaxID=41200 RepID=UPI0025BFC239|nr:GNAT family N-acetyltransferase [Bifidobacterium sp.]MCH4209391.1 GNAT family N-acetyltransferase [Bifidobacterium sp.]MCI1224970.1 GNAT family N-acetyltransferase [Bifidobacterium sp.]
MGDITAGSETAADSTAFRFVDITAPDDPVWEQAFPVLRQLRTELTREMLAEILLDGVAQPPTFTALFNGERCVAVAGWRLLANTHLRRVLYIDDLVADAACRSRGYGRAMLEHLDGIGTQLGIGAVDLDSGVQRFVAHRFYMANGFSISSHHFRRGR